MEEIELVEKVIGFEALYESMEKCRKGVMWKTSTASYVLNGIEKTAGLEKELKEGTYKAKPPKHFTIMHPKQREIVSIAFRDRVYQRSLNDNAIYPLISKSFIYDNMACQAGKGTDKARERLTCFLQRMYRKHGLCFYTLQADIKGYYPNMPHEAAKNKFKKALPQIIYKMAAEVLDGQYAGEIGFNPGSQMVQICGIAVLDEIDHYIKERLKIKCYIRYMDDLVLFHENKNYLEQCKTKIGTMLKEIGLEFHGEKTRIYPIKEGVKLLGFRFSLSESGKVYKTLDPKNIKNERRKLRRLVNLQKKGKLTKDKVDQCYQSWKAHAQKGNTYKALVRMDEYYKSLWEGAIK